MSEFVAPRSNGSLARYKWLLINGKYHAVDQERSDQMVRESPNFPAGMRAAQKFWGYISSLIMIGGFIALIWLPWYTPLIGLCVAYITFRANKQSAADFVAQIANQVPEFYQQMVSLEVIRDRESFGQTSEKT